MRRVTAPGGHLVAAVWDFRGGLVCQRIFWDTAAGIDPGTAVARDKLFSGALALPEGLVRLFDGTDLDRIERAYTFCTRRALERFPFRLNRKAL
jgi:hypothetical protein